MLLNKAELVERIYRTPDENRLSIVPMPSLELFERDVGASVDLRLGRWFRTMKQTGISLIDLGEKSDMDKDSTKEHFVRFRDGRFILHPGKFVLGITLEWITVPGNLAGHVTGKSSLGRRGLIIETAAGIQPGFSGCLTLELANVGEVPIALQPGLAICQIFFHQASSYNQAASSQFKGSRKPGLGVVR